MLLLIYSIGSKILRSNSTVLTQLITKRPKFLQQHMSNCYDGYMVNNNNKKAKHNISREKNAIKMILNIFLRKKKSLDYHMKLIYFLKWTFVSVYDAIFLEFLSFSLILFIFLFSPSPKRILHYIYTPALWPFIRDSSSSTEKIKAPAQDFCIHDVRKNSW